MYQEQRVKGISKEQRVPLLALRCRYIKLIGRPFKRNRLIHNKKLRVYLYLLHVTSLKEEQEEETSVFSLSHSIFASKFIKDFYFILLLLY